MLLLTATDLMLLLLHCSMQFMRELQGDKNIALALALSALQRQELHSKQQKQQVLHTAHSQLLGLVAVLLRQVSVEQQQHAEALGVQEQLQGEVLKLKRALAAAQQRKQAAETKARALQQQSKALGVALKAVASKLVDTSEQKAQLSASVEGTLLLQQCASSPSQGPLTQEQLPSTPSMGCSSSGNSGGGGGLSLQFLGPHAAVDPDDLPEVTDQGTGLGIKVRLRGMDASAGLLALSHAARRDIGLQASCHHQPTLWSCTPGFVSAFKQLGNHTHHVCCLLSRATGWTRAAATRQCSCSHPHAAARPATQALPLPLLPAACAAAAEAHWGCHPGTVWRCHRNG